MLMKMNVFSLFHNFNWMIEQIILFEKFFIFCYYDLLYMRKCQNKTFEFLCPPPSKFETLGTCLVYLSHIQDLSSLTCEREATRIFILISANIWKLCIVISLGLLGIEPIKIIPKSFLFGASWLTIRLKHVNSVGIFVMQKRKVIKNIIKNEKNTRCFVWNYSVFFRHIFWFISFDKLGISFIILTYGIETA